MPPKRLFGWQTIEPKTNLRNVSASAVCRSHRRIKIGRGLASKQAWSHFLCVPTREKCKTERKKTVKSTGFLFISYPSHVLRLFLLHSSFWMLLPSLVACLSVFGALRLCPPRLSVVSWTNKFSYRDWLGVFAMPLMCAGPYVEKTARWNWSPLIKIAPSKLANGTYDQNRVDGKTATHIFLRR